MDMLWVWTIESILLGLVALAVLTPMAVAQLVIVGGTGAMLLFCMAWPLESDIHNVTLAHLGALTGMLLSAGNKLDVNSIQSVSVFSWLVVLQVAALGMALSTKKESSPLWFQMESCVNLIVPMGMDYIHNNVWGAIGLSVAVVLIGVLPWTTARAALLGICAATLVVMLQTWWSTVPGLVVVIAIFSLFKMWRDTTIPITVEIKPTELHFDIYRTKRL